MHFFKTYIHKIIAILLTNAHSRYYSSKYTEIEYFQQ